MSARYDAPAARGAGAQPEVRPGGPRRAAAGQELPLDAATMWESLNGGEDPTEDDPAENAPPPARPAR